MRAFLLLTLIGAIVGSAVAQTNSAPARDNSHGHPPKKADFKDQASYGAAFTEWSKTRKAPIEQIQGSSLADGTQLTADQVKQRIADAVKTVTPVKPKKQRKLLVIESLAGMYHNPGIPECDLMIQLMGDTTGAWKTELNNDLNNLKWPKIKEYDAIFLNSCVGEMFPDPEVREGLTRFVREGGGLGGIHGSPWASRDWDEFAEMIGSKSAPHRLENGIIKVYDPTSPLVKSFNGKDLPHYEEYYRFETTGTNRFRWEKARVLMTADMNVPQKTPWTGYQRPDNIYPVSWVLNYGKGRTFYCSLGHRMETFTRPEIVGHIFSGIQFILGDLDINTTPNPVSADASKGTKEK